MPIKSAFFSPADQTILIRAGGQWCPAQLLATDQEAPQYLVRLCQVNCSDPVVWNVEVYVRAPFVHELWKSQTPAVVLSDGSGKGYFYSWKQLKNKQTLRLEELNAVLKLQSRPPAKDQMTSGRIWLSGEIRSDAAGYQKLASELKQQDEFLRLSDWLK